MEFASSIHQYIPPKPSDSRSPCPALNALANHGYLPHDGRNITLTELVKALSSVYGVSIPLGVALSLGGIILCGHGMKLDLGGLCKHNVIEHDASIAHRDLDETGGATPTNHPDPILIQAIIDVSDKRQITLDNLIQIKAERESRAHTMSLFSYHGIQLSFFSRVEPVLMLCVMGETDDSISVDRVKSWLEDERIPEGYTPRQVTGGLNLLSKGWKMWEGVNALHKAVNEDRRNA